LEAASTNLTKKTDRKIDQKPARSRKEQAMESKRQEPVKHVLSGALVLDIHIARVHLERRHLAQTFEKQDRRRMRRRFEKKIEKNEKTNQEVK
jgi:hypothetical protein